MDTHIVDSVEYDSLKRASKNYSELCNMLLHPLQRIFDNENDVNKILTFIISNKEEIKMIAKYRNEIRELTSDVCFLQNALKDMYEDKELFKKALEHIIDNS